MDCHNWIVEAVESARLGLQPDAELQKHLRGCPRCRDRWDDEQRLSAEIRVMRDDAAAQKRSEVRRETVMREFELAQKTVVRRQFKLALRIAAILLLTVALGLVWRNNRPAGKGARDARSTPAGNGFAEAGDAPVRRSTQTCPAAGPSMIPWPL